MSPGFPLRLPLAFLQLVFLLVVGYNVQLMGSIKQLDTPWLVVLGLPIAILCLPTSWLSRTWTVFLFTATNAALLVKLTEEARAIDSWLYFGYVLLMLMACLGQSAPQVVSLGGMLCALYGISIYRFESLATEQTLLLPIMLAMLMVYGTKTGRPWEARTRGREAKQEARSESVGDALTGLPNRAQFIEHVWRAIRCSQNNQDFMFAVLFVDLDGFKPINDNLGHRAGDTVLVETARRLQACLRKGDIVARYGGDEFTLLVHNVTGKQDAIRVAERVLRKVGDPILVGKRVEVGASIGIALSTNLHSRPEDLIRDADLAMYRAKSEGKGCYEISDQIRDTKYEAALQQKPG